MAKTALPSWRVWILAIRPWSLTITMVPILVATLLAWQAGRVSIGMFVLMLLASIFTHIGCNLANDLFDHIKGVDAVQQLGPGRMLQHGHLMPADLRIGIMVAFGLALLAGLPVIIYLGWLGIAIALLCAGIAFFYTGGPFPLAYNRLGEISVFLAMGVVMVNGAFYVHTGTLTWATFVVACALGMYAAGVLHANNIRDADVDLAHGKHTLANTFGRRTAIQEYAVLIVGPVLITIMLVVFQPEFWPLLAVLLVMPLTAKTFDAVRRVRNEREASTIVAITSKLQMRYGLYVSLGLVVMGIISS